MSSRGGDRRSMSGGASALRRLLPQRSDWEAVRRSPRRDLLAGVTVAVVALPLALAFGVASGLGAEAGIVTAVVAGAVAAVFGGSNLQVSGPTGAMTVVLIPVVHQFGAEGVLMVGLAAGVVLVGMSMAGLGRFVRFLPIPVIEGFTAGIAVVIALQQMPAALGVEPGAEERVWALAAGAVGDFLAAPDPDQRPEPLGQRPFIGLVHQETLGFRELQPGEGVVRDDLRECPPARASCFVHREKPRAGDALGHEGQLLPEPGIGARHGAARRCDHQPPAGIARHVRVQHAHDSRQKARSHADVGVQIQPHARPGAAVAVVQRADLAALRQFLDPQPPAARGKGRHMGAGARGGVIAAAVGDQDQLDRAAMVLAQDMIEAGVDIGGLVMGGQDDGAGGHRVGAGLSDGPRPDEILFVLAMTAGPRVHARMGGLRAEDVKGEDGLR